MKRLLILVGLCLLITSCSLGISSTFNPPVPTISVTPVVEEENLTIFAASSLVEVFDEMAKSFQVDHPGVEFSFNYAGSQQLVQQLAQGAPADIFASADIKQMDSAVSVERVNPDQINFFAGNKLVLVTPTDNPGQIQNLKGLTKEGLKLVLAAPEVPVGAYTLEFLENASTDPSFGTDYKEQVIKNVVSYEENVRAVLSKVILGEADAGIVYLSDALHAGPAQVMMIEIPDLLNATISYPIAPVKDSSQPELADQFIQFILSEAGQEILIRFGFLPVQ